MWEWAASRPRHGLKIGVRRLAWVETERNWRGRRSLRCLVSPVPAGAVRPSPIEPNLADPDAFAELLRSVTGPGKEWRLAGRTVASGVPRPISLILPDVSVRAVLLQLEHMPARPDERDALVRWRLGQEQLFPLAGTKVVFQELPRAPGSSDEGHSVLAVAVQEAILQQYETACEDLGLIPSAVGVASLKLFDLWLRSSGGRKRLAEDLLWVNAADGALTVFLFHQGRLVFLRTKLLADCDQHDSMDSGDVIAQAAEECALSIYACRQHHPRLTVKEAVVAGEDRHAALEAALRNELGVTTEQLQWEHAESLGWTRKGGSASLAGLSALAGVA